MKVLVFTSKRYDATRHEGVLNLMHRVVKYLIEQGDEVVVLAVGSGQPTVGEWEETVYFTPQPRSLGLARRALFSVQQHRTMRRVVRLEKPNAALFFASGSLFLGPRVLLLKRLFGSRIAIYISGLGKPSVGVNWFAGRLPVLVGSPFLLRWFSGATVAYPVTPIHFRQKAREVTRKTSEGLSLLYLGTAQRERGVPYLLAGFAEAFRRTRVPIRLRLALNGIGGENETNIQALIDRLGLRPVVSVDGIIDTDEAYESADVVVIPRQEQIRMAFPVRIVEALAYNTPLIVTSACEMGQLVDGCGLEVDPRRPTSLADAIVRLAEDRELYRRMVDACAPAR